MRKRSRRTMGKSTGSSGRCRPQTLQRFLSLGFNSMLPACHSDLRSVPVIRTAFRAGPKHQSCLIVGRWREGWGGQWVGGGDAETWRGIWADEVHFQIDTGALHSHIFAPTAQVDRWGTGGGRRERGRIIFLGRLFLNLHSTSFCFHWPFWRNVSQVREVILVDNSPTLPELSVRGAEGGRLIFRPLQAHDNTWHMYMSLYLYIHWPPL